MTELGQKPKPQIQSRSEKWESWISWRSAGVSWWELNMCGSPSGRVSATFVFGLGSNDIHFEFLSLSENFCLSSILQLVAAASELGQLGALQFFC